MNRPELPDYQSGPSYTNEPISHHVIVNQNAG
jgi:hypothetical protein